MDDDYHIIASCCDERNNACIHEEFARTKIIKNKRKFRRLLHYIIVLKRIPFWHDNFIFKIIMLKCDDGA